MTAPAATRLRYEPALDGLRAVALLGVIGYHAGIERLHGGFLGVSAFFTLSGFLITALLLSERASSGRIDLGSFWQRRLRRLLPAAMLTIAATVLLVAALGDDSQLARLRTDALASLLHASNWRFIAGGDSYGALFESPSFFRHFWSLAVEEQFYLVFPLAIATLLRVTRGAGRMFTTVLTVVAAAGLVWPAVLLANGATTDRLYFGTDTRLGELAVGALLAVWWTRRDRAVPDRPVVVSSLAVVAVAIVAAMWMTAHPSDRFLYQGGLAAHAGLTLVIIVAAVAPRGPLRSMLSWEPLRRLGGVSYGAYLFHWPILLVLQQETTLGPWGRLGVGLPITIVLAELSARWFEQPIRRGSSSPRQPIWLVVPATAAVAALIVAVAAWRPPADAPIDFARAQADLATLTESASLVVNTTTSGAPTTTGPLAEVANAAEQVAAPVRISAFGDSTALMTGLGIAQWAVDNPTAATVVQGQAKLGCGLVTGGTRVLEGRRVAVPADCDHWLDEWLAAIDGQEVDIAVVQLGAWDIVDHRLAGESAFLAIGRDDTYETLLRTNLETAVDALLAHSDTVMLIAHPDVGQGRLDAVPAGATYDEYDPARSARWREIVAEVAAARPDVLVVDLAGWIDERPDDLALRPDGVHFSYDSAREVAEWLGPQILQQHAEWLVAESTTER